MSADVRATVTALWERANNAAPESGWPLVTRLVAADIPPGFTAWAVGAWDDSPAPIAEVVIGDTPRRHVILLPSLAHNAPLSLHRRLQARVIALATGICPLCSNVAGLSRQPPAPGEPGRAAFHLHDLVVTLTHSRGCPAEFDESDRRWFDPRAVGGTE